MSSSSMINSFTFVDRSLFLILEGEKIEMWLKIADMEMFWESPKILRHLDLLHPADI